ncbi:MAG: 4-hydroxy-3-methylbut-2-enyl diphosphate reductase [Deltaproteobacteria bacterium]|nr:4-hydroxy-3-methylbut-2-enyl diphosphate reductase [Deltaproteobacteria bacterium]
MRVIKASSAGFCMGVSLAVHKLDMALAESGGAGLYTLGPIIHNPPLVAEYESKGVLCLHDHTRAEKDSTVLIRAHGLPLDMEKALRARGLRIIDATCPRVKSAQKAIARACAAGWGTLLLFGERDHPEVRGLLSYAGADALVFSGLRELEALSLERGKACFAAAQTTQDKNVFEDMLVRLRAFFGRDLRVLRTICSATRKRQEDVIELAGRVKSMVIVGGANSGNTRRLAEISAGLGVFTVSCETAENLPLDKLKQLQPVGLSAGASTPEKHISEVERVLIQS